MMKRWGCFGLFLLIGFGICSVVSVVGGILLFRGLLDRGREVGDRANVFMIALRDEKLDDAYTMFTPDLQELQSRGNFKEDFTGNSFSDWKFNNFSVQDDVGYVAGTAVDEEGSHFVAFQLEYRNGAWAISGYNMGTFGWVGTVIAPVD
ncbi:MAG: hypothetical protein LCI00_30540 [Chloroflexi bacterium]|nr:hypothetical protein [Chloroflexota bacterium]MCC6894732.1 hypothetical protein [Anaerolineae bacterium]